MSDSKNNNNEALCFPASVSEAIARLIEVCGVGTNSS